MSVCVVADAFTVFVADVHMCILRVADLGDIVGLSVFHVGGWPTQFEGAPRFAPSGGWPTPLEGAHSVVFCGGWPDLYIDDQSTPCIVTWITFFHFAGTL